MRETSKNSLGYIDKFYFITGKEMREVRINEMVKIHHYLRTKKNCYFGIQRIENFYNELKKKLIKTWKPINL